MRDCTHEEKIGFEGFTQNDCYSNQPHPFEAFTTDANSSYPFTKQDLTFKQAHLVSFWFCFQCFLQALSGNSLILHQAQCINFLVFYDRLLNVTIDILFS